MSPTPLIELQRRLAEAGRIRMGEKTDKGAPKRLTTWRITSPDESLIAQAAGLYGGKPEPWESPSGPQFEVVTTTSELPVLVMPGYSFRQGYEYRTSPTLVERRCDGIEMDDGQPCLCNATGEDKCALLTRLTVALPELTTMLGWRLETKGDNAARELLASMDLVRGVSGGAPFVPAKLKIVERRSSKEGQAVRFVVPVIDVQVRYAELLGGERQALPAGYTPLPEITSGVSLAEGLESAETRALTRSPRSAAPIPGATDLEFAGAPLPEPDAEPQAPTASPAAPASASADPEPSPSPRRSGGASVGGSGSPLTDEQRDKLDLLQRDYSLPQLIATFAKDRGVPADDVTVADWPALRERLTGSEAASWIKRMEKALAKAGATA